MLHTCWAWPEKHETVLKSDNKHPSRVDYFCNVVAVAARQEAHVEQAISAGGTQQG